MCPLVASRIDRPVLDAVRAVGGEQDRRAVVHHWCRGAVELVVGGDRAWAVVLGIERHRHVLVGPTARAVGLGVGRGRGRRSAVDVQVGDVLDGGATVGTGDGGGDRGAAVGRARREGRRGLAVRVGQDRRWAHVAAGRREGDQQTGYRVAVGVGGRGGDLRRVAVTQVGRRGRRDGDGRRCRDVSLGRRGAGAQDVLVGVGAAQGQTLDRHGLAGAGIGRVERRGRAGRVQGHVVAALDARERAARDRRGGRAVVGLVSGGDVRRHGLERAEVIDVDVTPVPAQRTARRRDVELDGVADRDPARGQVDRLPVRVLDGIGAVRHIVPDGAIAGEDERRVEIGARSHVAHVDVDVGLRVGRVVGVLHDCRPGELHVHQSVDLDVVRANGRCLCERVAVPVRAHVVDDGAVVAGQGVVQDAVGVGVSQAHLGSRRATEDHREVGAAAAALDVGANERRRAAEAGVQEGRGRPAGEVTGLEAAVCEQREGAAREEQQQTEHKQRERQPLRGETCRSAGPSW